MLEVLYQDEWFAVINKAANFLSVPGRGEDKQDSVLFRTQQLFGEAYAVHRLDYHTSGLLLIAKTTESHRILSSFFQERRVEKEYRAIIRGDVTGEQGEICKPLRCDWPNRPRQIISLEYSKKAITHWKRLDSNQNSASQTCVALFPVTGRSHQLRVHMQSIGHPILGDPFYDAQCNSTDEALHLHAYRLEFSHPMTGAWLKFIAVCPF